MRKNLPGNLIFIGLIILVSSAVFIFYDFLFVLKIEYQLTISTVQVGLTNNCIGAKVINSSYDISKCLTAVQNVNFPSYLEFLPKFLFGESIITPLVYFSPIILGLVLIAIGLILRKKL